VRSGYLYVETHSLRPHLVRIAMSERQPALPEPSDDAPRRIRYVARFGDSDAALMHAHTLLRRRLADAEAGLYRTDLVRAIAAVESLALGHRRLYLDPALAADTCAAIRTAADRLVRRRRRIDRICYGVGYGALLWLLLRALGALF
jgi:hypothetical protein